MENSLEVIFKKMTPMNIEYLVTDLLDQSPNMSPDTMGNIIDILFQKASSVRPDCNHVYIYFFKLILGLEVKLSSGETLKFKDLMQMRCQSYLIELLQKNERLQNHQNQVLRCQREKLLAFTTFISDLYNHDALTLETIWVCLKSLLAVKGEMPLFCVYRLLKGVGKYLDSDKGKVSVDEIFSSFYQMIRDNTFSAEVSFMLCELCDLRKNNWNSKGMQLSTFKRIRTDTSQESAPATELTVNISEPAARSSQETVIKNSEDTSQIMKTVTKTPKIPVEEVSEDSNNQDKTLVEVTKSSAEETLKSKTVKLEYTEGQWSPTNPQGKKKYHRGFLLQIRPYCTTRPKDLPSEYPVLEHCCLDNENEQFMERRGTSGFRKESQNTLKEDERPAPSLSTSAGQRKTTLSPDQRCLPNKEENRQNHRTKKAQCLPEANGVVQGKVSHGNNKQGEAISQRGRTEEYGPSSLPSSHLLSAASGGSSHGDEARMNACRKESPNRSWESSQVQSKCQSLPPCTMYNEQSGAKVTRGQESATVQGLSKNGPKRKETKQENAPAAKEQQVSSATAPVEGSGISSTQKSEPSLSEEEYETRVESILGQYLKLNNSQAVKSHITKLQTPHLQHMFIRLSIGRVVDGHQGSSEAIGRLFHELLSSGTISEEQFCKGLNDYLAVTEQIAEFTSQYWSSLGEIIGAMVSGGTKSLEFLKEVIQTTPGDGKAAVFIAEILKACIKFTDNRYQVKKLWDTSKFSWSLFIADKWSIKSFVGKQDLDFTLSPEERNARKPPKQVPQRNESSTVTSQSADENGRGKQTGNYSIPKFQNELMLLLKGNHLQHKEVFNFIDNAVGEDVRKTKEFIHALVLAVCLSSMVEGDDGPYTKCQRELLKRRSVLIQRYIRRNEDLEMIALQVVEALYASVGNPRGVLRTMCEVLYDEDVISSETFTVWRNSEDFSEENELATKKFFESLDQD